MVGLRLLKNDEVICFEDARLYLRRLEIWPSAMETTAWTSLGFFDLWVSRSGVIEADGFGVSAWVFSNGSSSGLAGFARACGLGVSLVHSGSLWLDRFDGSTKLVDLQARRPSQDAGTFDMDRFEMSGWQADRFCHTGRAIPAVPYRPYHTGRTIPALPNLPVRRPLRHNRPPGQSYSEEPGRSQAT